MPLGLRFGRCHGLTVFCRTNVPGRRLGAGMEAVRASQALKRRLLTERRNAVVTIRCREL